MTDPTGSVLWYVAGRGRSYGVHAAELYLQFITLTTRQTRVPQPARVFPHTSEHGDVDLKGVSGRNTRTLE